MTKNNHTPLVLCVLVVSALLFLTGCDTLAGEPSLQGRVDVSSGSAPVGTKRVQHPGAQEPRSGTPTKLHP